MVRFFDCWMVRWCDGWMGRFFDGSMVRWLDGWMARWVDGSMARWLDGSMGRWCDGAMVRWVEKSNQATIPEVRAIKEWLSKEEFLHWGISSIWAKAFKEGASNLSKQAWYRYNKILQFKTFLKKGSKPKNSPPLCAEKIDQIWHADITVFKALNGVRYYIYTVMDNYSRYILSWRIETIVSAQIRLETIQEAIHNVFHGKAIQNLQLVTDGGPENDNLTLTEFMKRNNASIHHTIALRDIVQSNSVMEAFYSITKY